MSIEKLSTGEADGDGKVILGAKSRRAAVAVEHSSVKLRLAFCLPLVLVVGCNDDSHQYTLYRSSALDAKMRLHVASFDSADGDAYNSENCQIAAGLFADQPGVQVRYWCEKGRFRK